MGAQVVPQPQVAALVEEVEVLLAEERQPIELLSLHAVSHSRIVRMPRSGTSTSSGRLPSS